MKRNKLRTFDSNTVTQKVKVKGRETDIRFMKIMKGDSGVCFFITNYYLENSVKCLGRKGRSNIVFLRMKALRWNQMRPQQFGKFLCVGKTKIDLVKFLINEWSSNSNHSHVLNGKDWYVTIEERAFVVSANANDPYKYPVAELSSQ